MNDFIRKVKEEIARDNLERVVVYGYASPEGKPSANVRLAQNRCSTIARYIVAKAGVESSIVEKRAEGIGWDVLKRLVEENNDVPCRRKVLDILEKTPVWKYDSHGKIIDSRKKQLMDLAGGRPWRWMLEHLFPYVRNAVAISLYYRSSSASESVLDHDSVEIDMAGKQADVQPVATITNAGESVARNCGFAADTLNFICADTLGVSPRDGFPVVSGVDTPISSKNISRMDVSEKTADSIPPLFFG